MDSTSARVTVKARPDAITLDLAKTAVLVVDMQNDFGSEGGMFQRAGIDVSAIRAAIRPTAEVLEAARVAGLRVIYLTMEFREDLSDLGAEDSPKPCSTSLHGCWRASSDAGRRRSYSHSGHLEYPNCG